MRSAGLGRLAYLAWHSPRASLARSIREGGPLQQWITSQGRKRMSAAARLLPPMQIPGRGAPEVYFLTGKRFWFQTAFCAWSLQHSANIPFRFVFQDDGSFDREMINEARGLFPGCRIMTAEEIEMHLDASLPAGKYPVLRKHRKSYVHLRKLTDFHAGRSGWKLVLDSDMLFFRTPASLLEWFANPDRPVCMQDIADAYGYKREDMGALTGSAIPSAVNVGVCGLRSDALDWDKIEAWCATLLGKYGPSYYLEQALVAMLLADQPALTLPPEEYRVMPDEQECRRPSAILHHYVDLSKRGYFRDAWKQVLPTAKTSL